MRVLVTGSQGQLGSEMPRCLGAVGIDDVVAAGRDAVDLADPDSIRAAFDASSPDVVVNCAAYNAVDQAETDPDGAMAVNATGVGVLAECCAAVGSHLVHVSTDYVFSGDKGSAYDESDTPEPKSAYGRSKLAGEEAVIAAGGHWTIVRTAWVFGVIGRSLIEVILDRGRAGEPLRMVDDQRGSPTHSGDLGDALSAIAAGKIEGLYHVTNQGDCTPFELSQLVLGVAGLPDVAVSRITSEELGRPAARPANSALVSVRLADAGLDPLRPLPDAVEERVHELIAARREGAQDRSTSGRG